ncbi:MAG: nuclease, partial [Dehalococcoidia bacterium]|nr:nuclease [Dehalococcoidia bacterium]
MSLDLTGIAGEVGEMVARLKAGMAEKQEHLRHALDIIHDRSINLDHLKNKITASRTTWLVAGLTDGLCDHYPAPPLPADFTVIASDGSHIDVDRHKSTRCYLINIGVALLHYGASPGARLESYPRLYSD